MSHFAKIDDGIVTTVIVAEQGFVDTLEGTWVQTSYNTRGGAHTLGGTPLRKNYAGVDYIYDSVRDAFYVPKPHNSWVLDDTTCLWEAPIAYPYDGKTYTWDEFPLDIQQWIMRNKLDDQTAWINALATNFDHLGKHGFKSWEKYNKSIRIYIASTF